MEGNSGLMWSTECVNDFVYSSREDGSKPSVSCLNFEPRVSKFPVLEVEATSNTAATMKSHYLFHEREYRLEVEYVKRKRLCLIVTIES